MIKNRKGFNIDIGRIERNHLPLIEEDEFITMLKNIKGCYHGFLKDSDCLKKHRKCSYIRMRNTMILKFFLSTGARVSEVSKLKIKDLDF